MSTLGWIARIGLVAGLGAVIFGFAAACQYIRDQRTPEVCDCGASDWLEYDECHTCLMCGELRRR